MAAMKYSVLLMLAFVVLATAPGAHAAQRRLLTSTCPSGFQKVGVNVCVVTGDIGILNGLSISDISVATFCENNHGKCCILSGNNVPVNLLSTTLLTKNVAYC